MTKFTPEHIADLRAKHAAATPWPYGIRSVPGYRIDYIVTLNPFYSTPPNRDVVAECDCRDSPYILAAMNELPAALDEIERLQDAFRRGAEKQREAAAAFVDAMRAEDYPDNDFRTIRSRLSDMPLVEDEE